MPGKILKILKNPDPILRKKSLEIPATDIGSKALTELCFSMAKTMLKRDGVGLAAPQIGKNIRVITVNTKDGQICMINPKITSKSIAKEWGEEGCLSVPKMFGQVRRHKKVACRFIDLGGEEVRLKAEGLLARVIQHEIDHLDGILFIDKAKDLKEAAEE